MIQATLVLLLVCAAARWLTRPSSAERHVLWAAALGVSALLPLVGALLDVWQPAWVRTVAELLPEIVRQAPAAISASGADIVIRANELERSGPTLAGTLAAIWVVGTTISLTMLFVGARRLSRLGTLARPIPPGPWHQLVAELSAQLGIHRPVSLFESPAVPIPITWGLRRPRIVLPLEAERWQADRRRAVLGHELAHVRRRDWVIQLLAAFICAVYWFHPLFWFASRRLRNESEHAADDVVVNLGVDARDYADHLLQIVRGARAGGDRWRSALAMAHTSDLEQRFEALLTTARNRRAVDGRRVGAITAAAVALVIPLAAAGLAPLVDATVHVQAGSLPPALDSLLALSNAPAPPPIQRLRTITASTSGAVITPPEVIEYTTPPLYSDEARRRRVEGIVTIEARIDVNGRVNAPRVVQGLGFGLDQNALVAVRQWRFRPGAGNGRAAEMDAEMDIEFNLRNEALNELIANDMATRIGSDVTPPRIIRTVNVPTADNVPAADGALDRRTGTVALDIVLLEDGRPKIVRVLRSLSRSLDERAIETFEQWRFTPAMKGGRPVKVRLQADITFR